MHRSAKTALHGVDYLIGIRFDHNSMVLNLCIPAGTEQSQEYRNGKNSFDWFHHC
jgi:hypothetical protein